MADVLDVALGGGKLLLGILLIWAGIAKLRRPQPFEGLVVRALPPHVWNLPVINSRLLTRSASIVELAVGVLYLGATGLAVEGDSIVVAVMYTGFVAILTWASRHEIGCGCFGSHNAGNPPGRPEIVRAVGLAFIAISVAIAGTVGHRPMGMTWPQSVIAALALLVMLALVAVVPPILQQLARRRTSGQPIRLRASDDSEQVDSRRQFLRRAGAATVLAIGAAVWLPESILQAIAAWIWLQPNYSARQPGESHHMWVDYDPSLGGQWVYFDWNDGNSEWHYTSYGSTDAWHTWYSEGDYEVAASVAGLWDYSWVFVQYDQNRDTCRKRLARCVQCCQNIQNDNKNCHNCCADCYYSCSVGSICGAGSCMGCWINSI